MPAFLHKLSLRIYVGVAMALLLAISMSILFNSNARDTTFSMRENELKRLTDTATSVLADLQRQVDEGQLTDDQARSEAQKILTGLRFEGAGYFFVFDRENKMIVHPFRPQWIGTDKSDVKDVNGLPIFIEMNRIVSEQGEGPLTYWFNKPDTDIPEPKLSYIQFYEPWGWIVGTGSYVHDVEAVLVEMRNRQGIIFLIGLIAVSVVAYWATRSVTNPLSSMKERMLSMTKGDIQSPILYTEYKSELGDMARSLNVFRSGLQRQKELEHEQQEQQKVVSHVVDVLSSHLAKMSNGDLDIKIKEQFPNEYEQLRGDFNKTLDTLQTTISEVIDASGSIRNGAVEISQASDDLSHRTESQAATLEETAAALDELTSSVRSAADGARSVEATMSEAREQAEVSGEVVRNAVSAMTEIEESSNHIAQIISVIDDIAFQTNLLALNAGVEAARAGEAGRGFAVVASEVRALAQRSSDAAMEIKKLISDSSQQVERGVDLVGKAGEALEQIVERVSHISTLISGIAEGAADQSTGLAEINTGMTQLDQVTQQNAAMVEEATAAGHLLNTDAGKLAELVSYFRTSSAVQAPVSAPAPRAPSAHGDWEQGAAEQEAKPDTAEQPVAMAAGGSGKMWQDF